MRANTDELADQILDIIERHIRMDPDDEGDPGEAAQRIIEDIIAPITDGEAVTTTDHAAEARKHIDWVHEWQSYEGDTPEANLANAGIERGGND